MRENYEPMFSGKLGNDFKEYIEKNLSIFDSNLVRSVWFEAIIIMAVIIVFDLIFCARMSWI
jgi:hypothetical protein